MAAGSAHAFDCHVLIGAHLDGAVVTEADLIAAGPMSIPAWGSPPVLLNLPQFCRVKGVAATLIGFEVWLPTQHWNGRFLSVGSGGFGGMQPLADLAAGLLKGYAVSGNDTGHQGSDAAWMNDHEKVRLWGHTATHLVTGPSKSLVSLFYRAPALHAYFQGCSTGGAQAMEEAEFYPEDYDGIVAGAPGMSYAHLMLSFLWGLQASDRPGGKLDSAKLTLLNQAVLDACDKLDGLADRLLSDPAACRFDPAILSCSGADQASCLSPAQVETARLIYQGPRNPRTGAVIYPGFAFGSEADSTAAAANPLAYGWTAIQGPLAQQFAIPLLRTMVLHDPQWDWRTFDWDKDVATVDSRVAEDITATNPDLSAFAARGGKLIIYQGWGDPLNAQTLPIAYRQEVIDRLHRASPEAAERDVDGFFRVFMAPGMGHCTGGPGPSRFDALSSVVSWVENAQPPNEIVAGHPKGIGLGGAPAFERPLCPYPQASHYRGGPPLSASSFICSLSQISPIEDRR